LIEGCAHSLDVGIERFEVWEKKRDGEKKKLKKEVYKEIGNSKTAENGKPRQRENCRDP